MSKKTTLHYFTEGFLSVTRPYHSLYNNCTTFTTVYPSSYITGDENQLNMQGRTCVTWVFLLTHVVMLPLCGLELYLVACNFNVQDLHPPTPPPTPPPTTPSSVNYHDNHRSSQDSKEYSDFVEKANNYALLDNDARLYVFLPSAVAAVTSLSILTASCLGNIFTTTVSLYTTFALGVLTLTCTLVSQSNVDIKDEHFQMAVWMLGSLVALLLMLSLQTVLAIWELRRQKAGWPTLNWMNLFTWNTAFLVARLTLMVHVVICLCGWESPMRGIVTRCWYWNCPHIRYPIWLSLPVMAAATYSLVVIFEAFFSYYLGISHRPWTVITLVGSGLCNILIAILGSPFFTRTITPHSHHSYDPIDMDITIFSTVTCIVTFIHLLVYIFTPNMLQKPFRFVKFVTDQISTMSLSDVFANNSLSALQTVNEVSGKVKAFQNCINNIASGVMSFVLIVLMLCNWWGHLGDQWGMIVLFAVNISILCRVVPSVLLYIKFSEDRLMPFIERATRTGIEGILVFIGFLGSVCSYGPYKTISLIVGLIMMVFTVIQIMILANEHSLWKKQSQVPPGDDQHILKEKSEVEADQNTSNTDTERDDVPLVA
ncbi:hypothetical protein Pcinc_002371 [Petrolisthes cinctipes]|uniref:Uncharacterized protein n=1 Tax=Petrolisthes cinctipes TaxID=88211 RepID=A0AAE1GL44_PETCI|nr:hypothetical protein Pcinc_002371 [Petrolisthes cinctipes]